MITKEEAELVANRADEWPVGHGTEWVLNHNEVRIACVPIYLKQHPEAFG